MRHFLAHSSFVFLAMSVVGMLLCIPSVFGTDATGPNGIAHTTSSVQSDERVNFDLVKLQADARIVYVSSGARALAAHMIDNDLRTVFRFSSSDLHPTVIIELAQSRELHRVSAVYETGRKPVDVYLFNKLPADPGDFSSLKPVASLVDLGGRSTAAVEVQPSNVRYVALRWTREKSSNAPFEVAEVSAFAFLLREQLPPAFTDGEMHLPSESAPDFSNKLGTLADPPTIASVSP